jgi:hypothetical protein
LKIIGRKQIKNFLKIKKYTYLGLEVVIDIE